MPQAEFFRRFGMYVEPGFLSPEACAGLCAEASWAPAAPAKVRRSGETYGVEETQRRTGIAHVSESTQETIRTALAPVQPLLERHFGVTGTRWRDPQVLVYRSGDFFGPHLDRVDAPDAGPTARGRRVSVIVFLNASSPEPSPLTYGGGTLVFYGLLEDPRARGHGLPVEGEPGLLLAFRPDLLHEVTPVRHGHRYTIVTWLAE